MEINKKNRTELKNFFLANNIPTQQHFEQFIDAGLNQAEDGIAKVQGSPLALQAEGEAVGTQEVLNLFSSFAEDNPGWSINLNPRVDAQEPGSNQPGFNIKDATGQSRLFIRSGDGSIGVGTIEPEARLTIQGIGNGSLIAAVSDTEQHSRIFEITQEESNGILSLRGGDTTLATRLSGAIETPSFFLGQVGVGTDNPQANLQVSAENAELRIASTGGSNDAEVRLGLRHNNNNKSWEFVVKQGLGNLEFTPVANENNKLVMKPDGRLETRGGLVVGVGDRADHINTDGALYRHSGEINLTVDNNFYIRDSGGGGNNRRFHFDTNNSRLAIGDHSPDAPLSISGTGKEHDPDAAMHISSQCILFGGNNAGKQANSAKISAGTHVENSLNIVGMASGTSSEDRKVDIFAEGGMIVRGHIKTSATYVVAFSVALSTNMTGAKNPLTFGQINYNIGNHFKSNNHFIAPVAGLYMFTMCMRHNTTDGDVGWRLRLNTGGYVNGAGNEPAERSQLIARTHLHMNSRTVITSLNPGDRVHIEQFGSGGNDNYSSGFEGILLQALA